MLDLSLVKPEWAKSIKICFVSHSANMGGAETALIEAIRALSKKGVTCHVLLPYEGALCGELAKLKVIFRVVKYKPWVSTENESWWIRTRNLLISLVTVVPASMAIIRWRSTLVYTNTITVFTGALSALLTRRPHIWHIHEFGEEDHGLKFLYGKSLSLRLMGRLSALCIANSRSIADAYSGNIPTSKLRVIYQSVSVSSPVLSNKETSAFRCVIVGKVSEGKRQEDAVKAVVELVKKGMQIELYIIGDGYQNYTAHITEIVLQNGVQESVKFMGYCDDAFAQMCQADVILMCSRSEAFGRVTVEGMLAGKPVIGARSGATPELIQDGVTGLLYTMGDYKELSQKIEYLYRNREMANQLGGNAKKWAMHRFTEEQYGEDLMRLLLNLSRSEATGGK